MLIKDQRLPFLELRKADRHGHYYCVKRYYFHSLCCNRNVQHLTTTLTSGNSNCLPCMVNCLQTQFVNKMNCVSKKFKEYDQNILLITILLSNITISTCTHVVRNLAKTNLRKHLNKLQIDIVTKTCFVCLHSDTFKRFSMYRYKYHCITVRFD